MLVWVHIVSPREPLYFLSLSRFSIPLFFCASAVLSRVSLRRGSRLWNDCQILCNTTNNSRWKGVEILFFCLFCFCLEEEHFVCMVITKLWDIPTQLPYVAVCSSIVLKRSPKKTSNAKVSGPAKPASYHKILRQPVCAVLRSMWMRPKTTWGLKSSLSFDHIALSMALPYTFCISTAMLPIIVFFLLNNSDFNRVQLRFARVFIEWCEAHKPQF